MSMTAAINAVSTVFLESTEKFYDTELNLEVTGPKKMITLWADGKEVFSISETIVTGWVIILLVALLLKWLTSDLKVVPTSKKQAAAEWIVTFFNDLVTENLGAELVKFAPYIATVFTFALTGSLISIFGLRSVTADINCTGTWAMLTFILITYYKFRTNGFLGYFKSFADPIFLMAPINVLSEVATPVSMALRMFGNISSGMIISSIVYAALMILSHTVYNLLNLSIGALQYFSVFQIGIPAVLSLYFDFFSSVIQSYVFIMLTMAYIRNARGTE